MTASAQDRFIRTVLGDIPADALGMCYAHEHLIIDPSYTTEKNPDFLLDDVDRCTEELRRVYAVGGRAMVDSMPMACGRNVLKLAQASRDSGVHILCPTGLHLAKYYPAWHWCARIDVDALAGLFVDEINLGIDANDGNGPVLRRTTHRAGLIKIASSLNGLTDHEHRVFRAAAEAHRATGAPIMTHTEQGTAAIEQVELLSSLDVDPAHVVLSHTDRVADLAYHRAILQTGVCVEYDSAFRWKQSENPTVELLVALLDEFPHQIMVGMDAARRGYWRAYGGTPGLTYLIESLVPLLKDRGVSTASLQRMFVDNPAAAFSFADCSSKQRTDRTGARS